MNDQPPQHIPLPQVPCSNPLPQEELQQGLPDPENSDREDLDGPLCTANVLNCFFNLIDPQLGHLISVFPRTRVSNRCPQLVQVYSKIGMDYTIPKCTGPCLHVKRGNEGRLMQGKMNRTALFGPIETEQEN